MLPDAAQSSQDDGLSLAFAMVPDAALKEWCCQLLAACHPAGKGAVPDTV